MSEILSCPECKKESVGGYVLCPECYEAILSQLTAAEKALRWIPVSKGLPVAKPDSDTKHSKVVHLVSCGQCIDAWYDHIDKNWYNSRTGDKVTGTHWCPITLPGQGEVQPKGDTLRTLTLQEYDAALVACEDELAAAQKREKGLRDTLTTILHKHNLLEGLVSYQGPCKCGPDNQLCLMHAAADIIKVIREEVQP